MTMNLDYKLLKAAENGDIEAAKTLAKHFDKLAKHKPEIQVGEKISTEEFFKTLNQSKGEPEHLSEAYKWWLKAAEAGDVEAMMEVGGRLYDGIGVERDQEKAFEWELKAAEGGNRSAMRLVAYKYGMNSLGVERDEEKQFEWYLKAAELGEENSIKEVAVIYGVKKNDEEANRWLSQLDEETAAEAMYEIGTNTDSIEWLTKVAISSKSGYASPAMIRIAEHYVLENDFSSAIEWYEKSAKRGNPEAMSVIGDMYYIGEGDIPQDYIEAFRWYSRAMKRDYNMASVKVARMLYYGIGVEKDVKKAFEIFKHVSETREKFFGVYRFNSVAKYFLAKSYENGEGTEKDLEAAYEWYLLAAGFKAKPRESTHRIPEAMYKAAEMTFMGSGCEQDFEKALEYYKSTYEDSFVVTHYKEDAATKVDCMYKFGEGIEQDVSKVDSWREEMAK